MMKCDNFVNIFHGKRFTKEGRQLTRFLSCSNPSETSLLRSLREHLLYVHSPVDGCASFFFPSSSDLLGTISGSARHESLGGCMERGEEIWAGGFRREDGGERTAQFGDFLRLLAICRLEAQSLLGSYRRVK
jgi:hypothetical protein